MNECVIRLKNYRCFEDTSPAEITIGNHFTSLVGQNNGGKSSFLKAFYELRPLWTSLQSYSQFFQSIVPETFGASGPQGVDDSSEIFHEFNDRGLSIELELKIPPSRNGLPTLRRATFSTPRNSGSAWNTKFFIGPDMKNLRDNWAPILAGCLPTGCLVNRSGQPIIDCTDFLEVMSALTNSIYIGPFRNAVNVGAADYFDLKIGEGFINTWHEWKTGPIKSQNRAINKVTEDIRGIFDFQKLEIDVSTRLKTLQLNVNDAPFKLREVGAGLSQFIVVFGNSAIRSPDLIFIDEPELNLHPALQIDFLTSLASYSKKGIVFATHSIGLARATSEHIYTFQKQGTKAIVKPFEQAPNYAEFLGEMSFSTFKEFGFDRILLVEGVTDVKFVQQLLRKLQKDHRIVVVPLGGDSLARDGTAQELGELKRLSSNISVLVDSEKSSADAPAAVRRRKFADACKQLGFDVCLTERRALDNYLSENAVKIVKGPKYSALQAYQRLDELDPAWSKAEGWKIVREMSFRELENTDVGKFVQKL